jgi:hypothetical protein
MEAALVKNRYNKMHNKYVVRIGTITNRNEIIRRWVIREDLLAAMDLLKKQIRELSSLRKDYESQLAAYRLRAAAKKRRLKRKTPTKK